jgi:hypothetical protein
VLRRNSQSKSQMSTLSTTTAATPLETLLEAAYRSPSVIASSVGNAARPTSATNISNHIIYQLSGHVFRY